MPKNPEFGRERTKFAGTSSVVPECSIRRNRLRLGCRLSAPIVERHEVVDLAIDLAASPMPQKVVDHRVVDTVRAGAPSWWDRCNMPRLPRLRQYVAPAIGQQKLRACQPRAWLGRGQALCGGAGRNAQH